MTAAAMTPIHQKVALATEGKYPYAIARVPSGWVMLGETQAFPDQAMQGYCLLFSDPVVRDFNSLDLKARGQWGIDCARVGDALMQVLGAYRINYETWGNLDAALHTHITPRFQAESDALRVLPPRQAYDWTKGAKADPLSPMVKKLIADIRRNLAASS